MKKSKILKAILSPIIKGLAIFAIFGFAVYVYGAVNFPTEQPNPVTGVVGQLVGFSATAVNGNQGGYKSANNLCDTPAAVPGSHICMSEEITRSYAYDNAVLAAAQADPTLTTPEKYFLWINNGPPGYTATLSNDCGGWLKNAADSYGSIWNIKSKNFVINPCSNLRRFACCK